MLNLFIDQFILLNITHQIVGYNSTVSIPSHLIEREFNITNFLIPIIIVSFSLITLAKYRNTRIIIILSKLFLSSKNLEYVLKEEMKINSISSIALLINYFIVFNACIFLCSYHILHQTTLHSILLSIIVSISFISMQIIGLWLVGIISGESKSINIPITETVILYETFGIILFFVALCWMLNPQLSDIFLKVFEAVIILEIIVRFSKCVISVLKRGVVWYYIILYLCTLEILPLVILYLYIKVNFIY